MQIVHNLFDDIENVYFIMKNGIEDLSVTFSDTDADYQRLLADCSQLRMYVASNLDSVAIEPFYNIQQYCRDHIGFLNKYLEIWKQQVENARKDYEQMFGSAHNTKLQCELISFEQELMIIKKIHRHFQETIF